MSHLNKVILCGNLTRDPELRYTPKGTAVCNFGLAMNRKRTGPDGQTVEDVTFIECVSWGKTAENVQKYMRKGRLVLLEGRLNLEEWTDTNTGQKRSKVRVIAEDVKFMPSGGSDRKPAPAPAQSATATPPAQGHFGDQDEDDIPF